MKIDPTALAGGLNVGYDRKSRKKWTPKPWAWNHHQMTGQEKKLEEKARVPCWRC